MVKVNEVRCTVSNASPLWNEGDFRVAVLLTVQVSAIPAKEQWPGRPYAHLAVLRLIDYDRDNGGQEIRRSGVKPFSTITVDVTVQHERQLLS